MKTETTECTELAEIEAAVAACNAVAVPDPIRAALVRDLGPVAGKLSEYARAAKIITVDNKGDADAATLICDSIAADIKIVKDSEVLSKITAGLFDLHRKWTGLRNLFVLPMARDLDAIRKKTIAWQEGERKNAEEIQRKLQAEADAKAAREREALLKKAESVKTPEKQEAYREQAAAVIAPTVTVAAPKSGLRISKAWQVKNIDLDGFYAALATRPDLRGFVEVNNTRLARSKAANPSMDVPGVTFEQVTR